MYQFSVKGLPPKKKRKPTKYKMDQFSPEPLLRPIFAEWTARSTIDSILSYFEISPNGQDWTRFKRAWLWYRLGSERSDGQSWPLNIDKKPQGAGSLEHRPQHHLQILRTPRSILAYLANGYEWNILLIYNIWKLIWERIMTYPGGVGSKHFIWILYTVLPVFPLDTALPITRMITVYKWFTNHHPHPAFIFKVCSLKGETLEPRISSSLAVTSVCCSQSWFSACGSTLLGFLPQGLRPGPHNLVYFGSPGRKKT